jgi:hypothetical protein
MTATLTNVVPKELPVMVESEVAYYLRLRLGPVLVWPFVLTTFRRAGNSDELLPYSFRANRRYYYAVEDVLRFAKKFAEECPDAKPNVKIQVVLAGNVAPTYRKTRIRYKTTGLADLTPPKKPALH